MPLPLGIAYSCRGPKEQTRLQGEEVLKLCWEVHSAPASAPPRLQNLNSAANSAACSLPPGAAVHSRQVPKSAAQVIHAVDDTSTMILLLLKCISKLSLDCLDSWGILTLLGNTKLVCNCLELGLRDIDGVVEGRRKRYDSGLSRHIVLHQSFR